MVAYLGADRPCASVISAAGGRGGADEVLPRGAPLLRRPPSRADRATSATTGARRNDNGHIMLPAARRLPISARIDLVRAPSVRAAAVELMKCSLGSTGSPSVRPSGRGTTPTPAASSRSARPSSPSATPLPRGRRRRAENRAPRPLGRHVSAPAPRLVRRLLARPDHHLPHRRPRPRLHDLHAPRLRLPRRPARRARRPAARQAPPPRRKLS